MAIANLLVPAPNIPQPNFSWLNSIADSLGGAIDTVKQDKSFNGLADRLQGGAAPAQQQPAGGFLAGLLGGKDPAMTAPVAPVQRSAAQGDNYQPFPAVKMDGNRQSFIDSLLPAAIEEGKRTGVDPRIIVAQAAQETGWGKSAPGNNYFGIKSHGQSGGNSMMTHEYVNGQRVNVRDSFRGYESPADSVRGYGDFITQNPRYKPLREAQGLDAQLQALQASGYATDPNYSRSVGAIARGIRLPDNASLEANAGVPYQPSLTPQDPNAEAQRQEAMKQIIGGQPDAASAVTAMAQGGMQPSAYVDPMVSTPNAQATAFNGSDYNSPMMTYDDRGARIERPSQQRQSQPAPMQVAGDANPLIAAGATPVQRGGVDPSVIQYMLRDRNLRETGLKLWAANAQGQKSSEPWQFVNLPDGTLARANQQTGAVERLGNFAKPNQDAVTVGDNLVNRTTGEVIYEGKPKTPASYQEFQLAKDGGFQGTYADWEKVKVPGTSVTVNNGEGDKFYEKLDQKNAETFSALSDTGMQARSKIAQIDRLEGLMANAPQGAVGALKQAAGEWGIPTEGLSDIQAASALLEKMVPEQRAPGSGPMSDADIKMFRASLPRVINQPGGNQLVFQTMRGIAQYEMEMGAIADKVANRELKPDGKVYSPADARRDIAKLENPLSTFKAPSGPTPNAGVKPGDVEDGYRFKGGSPSNPKNWEKVQ